MKKLVVPVVSLAVALGVVSPALAKQKQKPKRQTNNNQARVARLQKRELTLEKELDQLRADLQHLTPARQRLLIAKRLPSQHKVAPKPRGHYKGYVHFGGSPVITSPYLGIRSEFDASDLIVNLPTINEDLRLLQQRKKLEEALLKRGADLPKHPLLDLSGKVEGQFTSIKPFVGKRTEDINLSGAELNAFAQVGRWAGAFMTVDYDDSPPSVGGPRSSNSRLFVNKAFLTIGNLRLSRFYGTVGQFYVPFGRYASNMISAPLTLQLARTKARAALLGFHQSGDHGFYGSLYAFKSDSGTSGKQGQGGAYLGYSFLGNPASGDFAVTAISTMADSTGMQSTSGIGFTGFGANNSTEKVRRRVPGFDVHGRLSMGDFTLLAEYVTALRCFNSMDLKYNHHGAKPKALNVEGSYHFHLGGKPAGFALGYAQTWQSFAFNLPRRRYSAVFSTNLWRDTIESIEYHHDENYSRGTTAAGLAGYPGELTYVPTKGLGCNADAVVAQIGVYF
jgi:hypothetical protein